jgi:hypothetical protein
MESLRKLHEGLSEETKRRYKLGLDSSLNENGRAGIVSSLGNGILYRLEQQTPESRTSHDLLLYLGSRSNELTFQRIPLLQKFVNYMDVRFFVASQKRRMQPIANTEGAIIFRSFPEFEPNMTPRQDLIFFMMNLEFLEKMRESELK